MEETFINKKETALRLIKEKGPIIPSQISPEIHTDILFASAILSELVSNKEVLVSNIKFGGSPFYYLNGQESGLERYIERLHEKEKKALVILKKEKVLLDNKLDAITRVALRNVKDFAKPFEAKIGERKELFWRWFLLPKEEVKELVISILKTKPLTIKGSKVIKQINQPTQFTQPIQTIQSNLIKQKVVMKETNQVKQKKITKIKQDTFLISVKHMFSMGNITCLTEKSIRANTEVEFILEVPSALGRLSYYCKAIDKKRCSDKDLSSAFVQGQIKKLPVLFLTTGELTKKAEKMMKKEFTGMVFKKIE